MSKDNKKKEHCEITHDDLVEAEVIYAIAMRVSNEILMKESVALLHPEEDDLKKAHKRISILSASLGLLGPYGLGCVKSKELLENTKKLRYTALHAFKTSLDEDLLKLDIAKESAGKQITIEEALDKIMETYKNDANEITMLIDLLTKAKDELKKDKDVDVSKVENMIKNVMEERKNTKKKSKEDEPKKKTSTTKKTSATKTKTKKKED